MSYGGDYLADEALVVAQTQAAEFSETQGAQSVGDQFSGLSGAVVGGIPISVGGRYEDGTIAGDGTYIVVNVVGTAITISFSPGALPVALGLQALATVKCNTAAVPPTVNDDSGHGYTRFSQWIDTALDDIYICTNPAVGAASWRKVN